MKALQENSAVPKRYHQKKTNAHHVIYFIRCRPDQVVGRRRRRQSDRFVRSIHGHIYIHIKIRIRLLIVNFLRLNISFRPGKAFSRTLRRPSRNNLSNILRTRFFYPFYRTNLFYSKRLQGPATIRARLAICFVLTKRRLVSKCSSLERARLNRRSVRTVYRSRPNLTELYRLLGNIFDISSSLRTFYLSKLLDISVHPLDPLDSSVFLVESFSSRDRRSCPETCSTY